MQGNNVCGSESENRMRNSTCNRDAQTDCAGSVCSSLETRPRFRPFGRNSACTQPVPAGEGECEHEGGREGRRRTLELSRTESGPGPAHPHTCTPEKSCSAFLFPLKTVVKPRAEPADLSPRCALTHALAAQTRRPAPPPPQAANTLQCQRSCHRKWQHCLHE